MLFHYPEKARLQAEAKAAEEARRRAEAEAAAETRRKREVEREAARQALMKVNEQQITCGFLHVLPFVILFGLFFINSHFCCVCADGKDC